MKRDMGLVNDLVMAEDLHVRGKFCDFLIYFLISIWCWYIFYRHNYAEVSKRYVSRPSRDLAIRGT